MRVLVVEDDAFAREALTSTLRERGHVVVECVTGEQALAMHAAQPFPLLLIDWVLPGMDGLGLCRKLRALGGSNGAMPVIVFTTARSGPYDLVRGLDAGADDYLTKPIDPDLLSTRLAIAERMVDERIKRMSTESALQRSEAGFRALLARRHRGASRRTRGVREPGAADRARLRWQRAPRLRVSALDSRQ
jgi:sigma-B regulation protein RsbU (phosphoserine phosphatase)